jgi:hypothetical protein
MDDVIIVQEAGALFALIGPETGGLDISTGENAIRSLFRKKSADPWAEPEAARAAVSLDI